MLENNMTLDDAQLAQAAAPMQTKARLAC